MSAPAAAHGAEEGNGAIGKAIAAVFLVLFLMNNGAPDTTKMAVIVGVIVYLVVSRGSSAKKDAGGH